MTAIDVIVVGAGALGLSTAAELGARGAAVTVLDDGGLSASAVAAGMLAPAFEAVLDPAVAGRAPLLRQARDLWTAFEPRFGVEIARDGAEWRGPNGVAMAARLRAAGFEAEIRADHAFTPDDWRLDARDALKVLGRAPGTRSRTARVVRVEPGGVVLASGERLAAAAVVVASGWRPPIAGLPVSPIKGQAVRVFGPSPPRTLRAPGVYVAPARDGAVVGATMEAGLSDSDIDAGQVQALIARARAVWPEIGQAERLEPVAGVRGATPDGLPLAGRARSGLFVALGPRRNGWLLAPLVARVVADAVEGLDPGLFAAELDPRRFPVA